MTALAIVSLPAILSLNQQDDVLFSHRMAGSHTMTVLAIASLIPFIKFFC